MAGFKVVRADSIEPRPVKWLLEDEIGKRIPKGMPTLIAGNPGEGKSSLANLLTTLVTQKGGRVFNSNVEDLGSFQRLRLDTQGANTKLVDLPEQHPIFPTDYSAFAEYVRDEGIELIILDPVANHFRVSLYQDQECRIALTPLRKLAEDTGAALIFLHHTTETGALKVKRGAHPLAAIGGGRGGLVGGCRAVYVFGTNPHDDEERVLAHVKSNCGADEDSVVFDGDFELARVKGHGAVPVFKMGIADLESEVKARHVLAPDTAHGGEGTKAAKKMAAIEWLTEYLCLGPQPVDDLMDDAVDDDHSKATVRRAAKDLGIEHRRLNQDGSEGAFGPGSRIFWALPAGHPALLDDEELAEETKDLEKVSCCDKPDLDQDDEGRITCSACGTHIGTQTDIDDFLSDVLKDEDEDEDGDAS